MTDLDTNEPIRGPEAVRKSLIEAAVQLMAMRSPRQISGRELAKHAGVNYGLIHHYFGSKDAVFAEAVAVATEEMGERWDSDGILPVNTSDDAASYRTFAKLELDEARSPMTDLIHRIVRGQATATGRAEDDPDLLAQVRAVRRAPVRLGCVRGGDRHWAPRVRRRPRRTREKVSELSMRLGDG